MGSQASARRLSGCPLFEEIHGKFTQAYKDLCMTCLQPVSKLSDSWVGEWGEGKERELAAMSYELECHPQYSRWFPAG